MSERKSRPPKRADSASSSNVDELRQQRDTFMHTFFKKGAELTEELLKENERLKVQVRKVESENASLRTQLASDQAIRDALLKIEQLEKEKEDLLSQFSAAEAVTTKFTSRYAEIEEELANLANLYVASYQLHSAMRLPLVMRHLRELLAQLVGARAHAIYVADEKHRVLVPVASDGVELDRLPKVQLEGTSDAPSGSAGVIERVFLTGIPHVNEGDLTTAGEGAPAACVPMRIEDRALGVIVIYAVLPQKDRFVSVDFELFKMLAAQAATAVAGAMLYSRDDGRLPGIEVFRDLDPRTP